MEEESQIEVRQNPGIHPTTSLSAFDDVEVSIVRKLSHEWYITSGNSLGLGPKNAYRPGPSSMYRYLTMKPLENYQEMFNIDREIVVIFSPYESFQARTLDAIDEVYGRYQPLRIEKICSVVISKDDFIESKIRDLLKNERESQIIIPFSYKELLENKDPYFIRNRFKSHFYTRDLFAFEAPLKKDLYFFGRNDLVHSIVNRHRSNENSGLFGLRKTGKTSVIFGIERALAKLDAKSVVIDCQNPSLHRRRWNEALYYIVSQIKAQHDLIIATKGEERYTEKDAATLFEKEILKIHARLDKKNILLIFDEIENITFHISPSDHWSKGLDFLFFWQTLRSVFQRTTNVFSFLIVGTNAMCVETPTIQGKDNPIFNQVPFEYIAQFDVPQTREMVRKLSRIMGLRFAEIIYAKLTEDFGGHPFLMRHVCSVINNISDSTRPVVVDKLVYEKAKDIFNREYTTYIDMILNVLREHYNDEYTMLEYLARGDVETFNEFAAMSQYYTNHLLGYGIIDKGSSGYSFRIESVKNYLANKQKYKRLNMSQEDMLREISERRNNLEPKIRTIIRTQLVSYLGKSQAKEIVLSILGDPRKSQYSASSYEDIFNPNLSIIYFEDLRKIILKHWDYFKHIFTKGKQDFDAQMHSVNKYRADAHAKHVTDDEINYFRVCILSLEKQVEEFLG